MAKLMLVEDDNNLREIYEARLQAEGYEIVSAKDGEEALVVAKKEKPELIISDVMMPKISGFEMLDILRNTEGLKEVKVIMLTALGQTDDQQRASKLGADRYLVKSQVTLEDIVKAAHELLGDAEKPDTAPAPAPPSSPTPAPATPEVQPQPQPSTITAIPVISEPSDAADAAPAQADAGQSAAQTAQTAQSTDQEEAAAKEQIENFVAGASQEPTKPEQPAPATQTAPSLPPTPEAQQTNDAAAANKVTAENSADDDRLVEEAAQALVDSTSNVAGTLTAPTPSAPPAAPSVSPASSAVSQQPAPPAAGSEVAASQAQDPAAPKSRLASRGEKVIAPLNDDEPKKDLNTLLAIEEGRESGATSGGPSGPSPSAVAIDDSPATQPVPAAPAPNPAPTQNPATNTAPTPPAPPANGPPDPNSIAL